MNDIRNGKRVDCCEDVCLMPSRAITNTNGNQADGVHLAHYDDGVTYRGGSHRKCNLHAAAVKANALSRGLEGSPEWVL